MKKTYKAILLVLSMLMIFPLVGCDSSDYNKAIKAAEAGEYETAIALFETLGDYKDSTVLLKEANYNFAVSEVDNGNYEHAAILFADLGDYKDSAEQVNACNFSLLVENIKRNDMKTGELPVFYIGEMKEPGEEQVYLMVKVLDDDSLFFSWEKIDVWVSPSLTSDILGGSSFELCNLFVNRGSNMIKLSANAQELVYSAKNGYGFSDVGSYLDNGASVEINISEITKDFQIVTGNDLSDREKMYNSAVANALSNIPNLLKNFNMTPEDIGFVGLE